MIVGGYSLDLYCDYCGKGKDAPELCWGTADYAGDTFTDCAKQARRDGWVINMKIRKCYCPKHSKRK